MLSRKSTRNSILLVGSWLIISCDNKHGRVGSPNAEANRVQSILVDPLERDQDVLALTKPGHWRVQGQDGFGHQWEGYLIIEHASDAFMSRGFFDWTCKTKTGNAGGRYHFEGHFDPETLKVRWTGFTIKDRMGSVGNACYEATLAPDGHHLTNGSWQGGIAIPGTWNARLFDVPVPESTSR